MITDSSEQNLPVRHSRKEIPFDVEKELSQFTKMYITKENDLFKIAHFCQSLTQDYLIFGELPNERKNYYSQLVNILNVNGASVGIVIKLVLIVVVFLSCSVIKYYINLIIRKTTKVFILKEDINRKDFNAKCQNVIVVIAVLIIHYI